MPCMTWTKSTVGTSASSAPRHCHLSVTAASLLPCTALPNSPGAPGSPLTCPRPTAVPDTLGRRSLLCAVPLRSPHLCQSWRTMFTKAYSDEFPGASHCVAPHFFPSLSTVVAHHVHQGLQPHADRHRNDRHAAAVSPARLLIDCLNRLSQAVACCGTGIAALTGLASATRTPLVASRLPPLDIPFFAGGPEVSKLLKCRFCGCRLGSACSSAGTMHASLHGGRPGCPSSPAQACQCLPAAHGLTLLHLLPPMRPTILLPPHQQSTPSCSVSCCCAALRCAAQCSATLSSAALCCAALRCAVPCRAGCAIQLTCNLPLLQPAIILQ